MRSNERGTFFPSNCTSKEKFTNSALPLILLEAIPPPAVPPSSPVDVEKFESFVQIGFPSAFTFFVPFAVSPDLAMFGYGMGTNGAGGAGVLQTSGNAIVTPLVSAFTIDSLFTPTLVPMVVPSSAQAAAPTGFGGVPAPATMRMVRTAVGSRTGTCVRQSKNSAPASVSTIRVSRFVADVASGRPRCSTTISCGETPGSWNETPPDELTPVATTGSSPRKYPGAISPGAAAFRNLRSKSFGRSGALSFSQRSSYVPAYCARGSQFGDVKPNPAGVGRSPHPFNGRAGSSRFGQRR